MLPAIVASPPVISVSSSDWVMREIYGLTMIGASVCPMNTFAATARVSAPLVLMTGMINRAIILTTSCRTPRW